MVLIEYLKEVYNKEYYEKDDRILICIRGKTSEPDDYDVNDFMIYEASAICNTSAGELRVTDIIDYIHENILHVFEVLGVTGNTYTYIVIDRESV